MSYEKQIWLTGDKITAAKLNHLEDGVRSLSEDIVGISEHIVGSNRFNMDYTDDEFTYTNGWAIGKTIVATLDGRGNITDQADRAISHPIMVDNGNTYYFHMFTDGRPFSALYVFGYDENGNFVTGAMSTFNVNSFLTPDGVSYIRLLVKSNSDAIAFGYVDVSTIQNPPTYTEFEDYKTATDVIARKEITSKNRIITVDKNGNYDFTTILEAVAEAIKTYDTTVIINAGEYNIIEEFEEVYGVDFFENFTSSSIDGISLSNRVHLIFASDSKVLCNYTGDNTYVMSNFSPFRSGKDGFTIENATIEASKVRYAFHDERGTMEGNYKAEFRNCSMTLDNRQNTAWASNSCIGGGLGRSGEIVIDGCYFNSLGITSDTSVKACVAYHNSAYEYAKSNIVIKNNYIDGHGTFVFQYYGTSQKITKAFVCGNSIGSEIICRKATSDANEKNIELIAWNNVVRN